MQAVILAGGRGKRLIPLTDNIPKPMISIGGKPFLQYQLELIKSSFTTEILLLVGYLGEKIEEYFGDGAKFGLKISYSYEKVPLGTGGALKLAEGKLKDEFILLNGDTYLSMDYQKLIDYFHQSKGVGLVCAYRNSKIAANNLALGERNLIIGYNKKDSKEMTHIDCGVMVFKKKIVDFIPQGKISSLEEDTFLKLIKVKKLYAHLIQQRFYDIGSSNGLEAIKDIL